MEFCLNSVLMPQGLVFIFSVQSFNLAKHLNTAPELVHRAYNRPTLETLESKSIQGSVHPKSLKVCVRVAKVVWLQVEKNLGGDAHYGSDLFFSLM